MASNARSSSARSTQAKRGGSAARKSSNAAKRPSSGGSRSTKRPASAARSTSRSRTAAARSRTAAASSNGAGANGAVSTITDGIGSAARKASTPVLAGGAAAAGLVGGIVLGKRVLGPRRTVLGIPVRKGLGLQPMAKEVHKAGKQIGRLTDELAQARKQAKKVGNALS
jgi:hypothetical protein